MTEEIGRPAVIEWSASDSLSAVMKALRSDRDVEVVFEGSHARLLAPHLRRFLDEGVSLGWRDLWVMVRTLRFHTAYFYAESGGRVARARKDGDRLIVEFAFGQGRGPAD
jgi:hypothetical protein